MNKLRALCRSRGLSLRSMLKQADVSPNAFYTLARKRSVIPKSLQAIATCLDTGPRMFLMDTPSAAQDMRNIEAEVARIMKTYKIHDRDNVRHALLLAREKPVERLRRALIRAQGPDLHRKRS